MTTHAPYISSWAYIPLDMLGSTAAKIKSELTIYPRQFMDAPVRVIHLYDLHKKGYLGLPIEWALDKFPTLGFEDRTTPGEPCYYNKLPDPTHPRAAPGQADFMADMRAAMDDYFTVLARAATGAGKTVVFLDAAARRGRRTLIIVHLQRLARQWANEIHDKLGIPYDDIGWVQGEICNYDHPFVIAIANSLAERAYPKAFYQSIGTVGYDEGHRFGAPLFAQTIGLFEASSKVIMTATDKRKDGCAKVFHYYFGQPKVIASQPAMEALVHSIEYPCKLPRWAKMPGHIAGLLAEDEDRNDLILRIVTKLYLENRQALFLGDRVEHLQHLIDLAIQRGIPASAMGLFVNQRYTGKNRSRYSKATAAARNDCMVYWKPHDGTEYLFEHLALLRIVDNMGAGNYRVCLSNEGRIPDRMEVVHIDELRKLPEKVPVMAKVSHEELDYIGANSQLKFATYGMLKEGIDFPQMDAGCPVTPRADAEQAIGRVRRVMPGKLMPVWYDIFDTGHPVTTRSRGSRIREYRSSNCRIIEHGRV